MEHLDLFLGIGGPMALIFIGTGLGGLLAGWTGWGGWIVAGAVVWIFFPPLVALVAAQPVVFAMDTLLAGKGKICWSEVRRIMPWALPGVFLGALLMVALPPKILLLGAGAILGLAVFPHLWRRAHIPHQGAGLLGGIWTTAGGWNAPPLALAVKRLSADERRGTLGIIFVILSLLALPALLLAGIDQSTLGQGLVLGAMLAPIALVSTWVGLRTKDRAQDELIIRLGQGLSLLGAIVLIVRAL